MTRTPRPRRRPGRGILRRGKSSAAALAVAVVGILVVSMMPTGPTPQLAHAQTADSRVGYAENGTRPVGVFHAYDQDGDHIEWSLSGPDAGRFTIDDGVLAFRQPQTTKTQSPQR